MPLVVHASSTPLGWKGLFSSFERAPAIPSCRLRVTRDERIVIHRSVGSMRWRHDRSWMHEQTAPGVVHLIPGGMDVEIGTEDDLDTQTIILDRDILIEVASEIVVADPDRIELRHAFYSGPTTQRRLFQSIGAALISDEPASSLYAEYAARALAAQLLIDWCAAEGRSLHLSPLKGRGPTLGRAMDFMRANLGSKIDLQTIARAVGVSTTILHREFQLGLGVPPHQTLLHLRLQNAQSLLARTRSSLSEVAAQCGFSSQEHMTRAFRVRFGVTPGAYRKAIVQ